MISSRPQGYDTIERWFRIFIPIMVSLTNPVHISRWLNFQNRKRRTWFSDTLNWDDSLTSQIYSTSKKLNELRKFINIERVKTWNDIVSLHFALKSGEMKAACKSVINLKQASSAVFQALYLLSSCLFGSFPFHSQ